MWLLIGTAVLPALAIGIQIGVATGSVGLGVGSVVVFAALLYGVVRFMRARVENQLSAIERTGTFAIDAGLDFSCLPGDWPIMARETLHPSAAGSTPMFPVRLAVHDGVLHIDKKQSWGAGRGPWHAEVALSEISAVSVGEPQLAYAGSSLKMELDGGGSVRAHLQLPRARAEAVAEQLRRRLPSPAIGSQRRSEGIVVHAERPQPRTSAARATGLLMLTVVPFCIAMLGAKNGPVAVVATLLLFICACWFQLRRPVTMHRWLAAAAGVASIAFAVDAATSGQLWRLAGTAICLVLAWRMSVADAQKDG